MSEISYTTLLPQLGMASRDFLGILADRNRLVTGTALASAARTAVTLSSNITVHDCTRLIAFLNISAVPGAGGLSLRLLNTDPVSGNTMFTNAAPAAVAAVNTFAYCFGPDLLGATLLPSAATQYFTAYLARTIRFYIDVATADSYTYSVGYCLIP